MGHVPNFIKDTPFKFEITNFEHVLNNSNNVLFSLAEHSVFESRNLSLQFAVLYKVVSISWVVVRVLLMAVIVFLGS